MHLKYKDTDSFVLSTDASWISFLKRKQDEFHFIELNTIYEFHNQINEKVRKIPKSNIVPETSK